MARWESGTLGRLERAALQLFEQQGYDRTTVAQIARAANLTERSFYRWFPDKREVLFGGGEQLETLLVSEIRAVPTGVGALSVLLTAFAKVPSVLRTRDFLRKRSAVIAENPPLHERELMKLASLSEALVTALMSRGCDRRIAQMTTGIGMAVLRSATERWMADERDDFADALWRCTTDVLAVIDEHVPKVRERRRR